MRVLQFAKRSIVTLAAVSVALAGCGGGTPEVPCNPTGNSAHVEARNGAIGAGHVQSLAARSGPVGARLGGGARGAARNGRPVLVLLLPPADHELGCLNGDLGWVTAAPRHRQRETPPLGLAVSAVAPLDIIRRITVGAFDHTIEHALDLVEAQQERTG